MFAEKQLDTSVQAPADLYFLCDPDKLQRVLDNLLRNAVNYSFPESVIKIRLYVDMGILTLIVENEGSTIPRKNWNGSSSNSSVWTLPEPPETVVQALVLPSPRRSSNFMVVKFLPKAMTTT